MIEKPKKKDSPKGFDCKCSAKSSNECGCYASWVDNDGFNQAIDQYEAWLAQEKGKLKKEVDVDDDI